MFVLNKRFKPELSTQITARLLSLLKDYSFEIFQQRRATVGHTFFDAIKNTLVMEAKQGAKGDDSYLNSDPVNGDKKHFFSRTGKERKDHLKRFLLRMQSIHKTMCKTDAYLNLLIDKNGQIVKDSSSFLAGFDKDADKVSFKVVKNGVKYTHILTMLLISSDS